VPCILLIDDHALFRSGLRMVLLTGIAGLEVTEAASLEQALQLPGQPPQVVLLDIQLQGLNGLEGLGLLHRRWPGVPVVMLSSDAAAGTVREAMARGAAAFVSKADTADNILAVVTPLLLGLPAGAPQRQPVHAGHASARCWTCSARACRTRPSAASWTSPRTRCAAMCRPPWPTCRCPAGPKLPSRPASGGWWPDAAPG